MTLPAAITAYLTEQGIPTDDLDATFLDLRLDPLDRQTMAMIIADPHGREMPADASDRWQTLADVVETARVFGGVGV